MTKRDVTISKSRNNNEKKISFFSKNIRRRRLELGMTQMEFAEKARLHQKQVSELENGRFVEYPERIVAIARALDTDPNYLFGFTEEP